jgi:hypothetical protein
VGDDVAVLRIEPPFDLSAVGIAAIPPVSQGAGPATGSAARLFGWGQVEAGHSNGRLHRLDQGLLEQWQCTYGAPSVPRDGQARLSLRLPALTVGGIPYRGSTLRVRLHPLGLARGRETASLSRHVGKVR